MAADRGFLDRARPVASLPDEIASCLPDGLTLNWHASLEYDAEDPSRTVEALRSLDAHVLGVLVGCESVRRVPRCTNIGVTRPPVERARALTCEAGQAPHGRMCEKCGATGRAPGALWEVGFGPRLLRSPRRQ